VDRLLLSKLVALYLAATISLKTWASTSQLVANLNKLFAGTIQFLSSAFFQLIATMGLIAAAFLIFNKWDEMDGLMRTFTVTLGIASAAILLLGTSIGVALAPFLAIVAVVAGAIAIFAGLYALVVKLSEDEYDKQVKANRSDQRTDKGSQGAGRCLQRSKRKT
jgi:hypothetical protein